MNFKKKKKNKILNKGDRLRENSSFKKALKAYEEALKLGSSFKAELGIAHCLRMIGDFEGSMHKYEEISKKYKSKKIYADSLLGKALSLKGLSRINEALNTLRIVEKTYEDLDDELGLGNIFWAYSGTYRIKGDFGKSVDYGLKALSIFKYYNFKKGILYSFCALGGVFRILGDLDGSFEYYTKANELAKKMKDKFGTAYSYCGLGNFYRMKNNLKEAIEYFKKAEEIYEKIGDIVSFSYTLWSMGILKTIERNFKESNYYFEKGLKNFEKTKDRRGIIYCYLGLIQLKYLRKDDYLFEIKNCKKIFKKYNLKWEKLLFEILLSKIKNGKKKFKEELSFFGTSYEFKEFPLNIP